MDVARLRSWVTLGALAIALAHIVFPRLAIDAVALVLIVVAVVPWLAPLFKSVQIPGGWKVEFQELQDVAAKAGDAGLLSHVPPPVETEYAFQSVADRDPNLALAGLRVELERRLVRLAEAHDIGTAMEGMGRLLSELARRGILSEDEESVLSDLVHLLNAAVHGASVDPRATEWAMDVGPQLIQSFEEKLAA